VIFIERRGQRGEAKSSQFDPRQIRLILTQAAVRENGQDEVLGHVTAFADDAVPELEIRGREIRCKKTQYGVNESRGLIRREIVGGKEIDDDEPDDQRKPVFGGESFH